MNRFTVKTPGENHLFNTFIQHRHASVCMVLPAYLEVSRAHGGDEVDVQVRLHGYSVDPSASEDDGLAALRAHFRRKIGKRFGYLEVRFRDEDEKHIRTGGLLCDFEHQKKYLLDVNTHVEDAAEIIEALSIFFQKTVAIPLFYGSLVESLVEEMTETMGMLDLRFFSTQWLEGTEFMDLYLTFTMYILDCLLLHIRFLLDVSTDKPKISLEAAQLLIRYYVCRDSRPTPRDYQVIGKPFPEYNDSNESLEAALIRTRWSYVDVNGFCRLKPNFAEYVQLLKPSLRTFVHLQQFLWYVRIRFRDTACDALYRPIIGQTFLPGRERTDEKCGYEVWERDRRDVVGTRYSGADVDQMDAMKNAQLWHTCRLYCETLHEVQNEMDKPVDEDFFKRLGELLKARDERWKSATFNLSLAPKGEAVDVSMDNVMQLLKELAENLYPENPNVQLNTNARILDIFGLSGRQLDPFKCTGALLRTIGERSFKAIDARRVKEKEYFVNALLAMNKKLAGEVRMPRVMDSPKRLKPSTEFDRSDAAFKLWYNTPLRYSKKMEREFEEEEEG